MRASNTLTLASVAAGLVAALATAGCAGPAVQETSARPAQPQSAVEQTNIEEESCEA
jgi:hypothetical protein